MVTGLEITAAYQGLKAGLGLLQTLNATAKTAAVNEVKVQLTQVIIEAQQALAAASMAQANAAETIRDLEQQVMQFENWQTQREHYELADTGQGSLAYRYKAAVEGGEPPHWLCPNCYEHRQKSIMKHEKLPVGRCDTLVCHPCGLELVTRGVRMQAAPSRPIPKTVSPWSGGRR